MIEAAAPELHDAILLCAGVAAVYMVIAIMQLFQIKRQAFRVDAGVPSPVTKEPSIGRALLLEPLSVKADQSVFTTHLERTTIDAELKRLNDVIGRQKTALTNMSDEIKCLLGERSGTATTPNYNVAMEMAKQGLDAVAIATRCRISIGEAQLVASLVRKPGEPDNQPLRCAEIRNERRTARPIPTA